MSYVPQQCMSVLLYSVMIILKKITSLAPISLEICMSSVAQQNLRFKRSHVTSRAMLISSFKQIDGISKKLRRMMQKQ